MMKMWRKSDRQGRFWAVTYLVLMVANPVVYLLRTHSMINLVLTPMMALFAYQALWQGGVRRREKARRQEKEFWAALEKQIAEVTRQEGS